MRSELSGIATAETVVSSNATAVTKTRFNFMIWALQGRKINSRYWVPTNDQVLVRAMLIRRWHAVKEKKMLFDKDLLVGVEYGVVRRIIRW